MEPHPALWQLSRGSSGLGSRPIIAVWGTRKLTFFQMKPFCAVTYKIPMTWSHWFKRDLSSLKQWTIEWCMTFHVKQCQMVLCEGRFVVYSTAMVYTLCEVPLVVVDSFKYLEVFVSNNFEWDMHIDDLHLRPIKSWGWLKEFWTSPLKGEKSCIFNSLQTNNRVCLRGLGPISF